jgi:3-phenylpropionate/trans-cinnamate dioxygenase ferredoxin subunit
MSKRRWVRIGESQQEFLGRMGDRDTLVVVVEGKKICLARQPDGLKAIQNKCPHAAGALGDGWCGDDGNIICPLHRYSYDLETGRSTDGNGLYAEPYPLEEREDGLYLGFRQGNWFRFW